MEILRVQPYTDINVTFTVPTGYVADTDFLVRVTDMADLSSSEQTYTRNTGESINVSLPGLYDSSYRLEIFDESDNVLKDETYEVVRPYVSPSDLGSTAGEIADAKKNEEIARAIIDSIVSEGFYYKKKVIETIGNGTDYMPIWDDVKKVLQVYENNILVTDTDFEITKDKTSITPKYSGAWDRNESARIIIPAAMSDFPDTSYAMPTGFVYGRDYKFVVEVGYTSVPSDIARATTLLIEDLACGKLDYYKRFVTAYNTDQFRLQFDKQLFDGTGNIIVDKILSKYKRSIKKLGVL